MLILFLVHFPTVMSSCTGNAPCCDFKRIVHTSTRLTPTVKYILRKQCEINCALSAGNHHMVEKMNANFKNLEDHFWELDDVVNANAEELEQHIKQTTRNLKKLEARIKAVEADEHINTKIGMVLDLIKSVDARLKKLEATTAPKTG